MSKREVNARMTIRWGKLEDFKRLTLHFSGSPAQLNKEARSRRAPSKRLFGAPRHSWPRVSVSCR
jgi:hypothetical protein